MPNRITDIRDRRFGKLVALTFMRKSFANGYGKRVVWKCRCDCGRKTWVVGSTLRRGRQTSCGCSRRKPLSAQRVLYSQYRFKAKIRNIRWSLSFKDFCFLISKPCYYTGRPPSNVFKIRRNKGQKVLIYSGIDRLNNRRGYEKSNCVPCCAEANRAKLAMTSKEFINLCKAVVKQSQKGGQ